LAPVDHAPGTFAALRAILGWVDSRLRWRWLALLPVVVLVALIEAVAALAVFGLLRIVAEPHRVRTSPVVSSIWQAWPSDDPPAIVAALTVVVALFYLMRGAVLVGAEWLRESTAAKSAAHAAERLFAHHLAADYLVHLRRRPTALIQDVARATDVAFQLVVGSAVNIMAELATLGALAAVLVLMAPPIALAAIAAVLVVAVVPILVTRRVWVRLGFRQKELEEQQLHVLHQSLGAIKEVKINARESFFEARLRAVRRALARIRRRRAVLAASLRLGFETLLIVSLLLVIVFVIVRGASGGDAVSVLALFAYAGFRAVPSVNRLMLNAGYIREGRAFVTDALASFQTTGPSHPRHPAGDRQVEFTRDLVCEDVSFAYEPDGIAALQQIRLVVRPGESLGIVGPTGSGKSTLVAVLLGLLRPTSGRVLVDGEDIAGRERGWQRLVGYVPQDPYVLDDTIRRNIAFGVPDALIDEQRVARACSLAQLEEVLRTLPSGLDTVLGEKGSRLSGGQRQRVAIARALYGDPAVLVFDEATAALDHATEREVTRAIESLQGTRTVIVIAHRLSTVQGCSRLIFLREGRVTATGTYEELMRHPAFKGMG
jgi:ATP-binding cassette, subfamily B, bacterial PglK